MQPIEILPGTGRGTMRSMVEGAGLLHNATRLPMPPSTVLRTVPLPVPGRI
jgi:hypothetical protein